MPIFQRPKIEMTNGPKRIFGMRQPILDEGEIGMPQPQSSVEIAQAADKPNFGQKLGRLFGISKPEGETDQFGLKKPAMEKEGVGSKVLSYLLPLAVGAIGGVPFHALAASHAGNRALQRDRSEKFAKEQKEYNEQFQKMANPEKPGDQKTFEWLESLAPEARSRALEYKQASNPLGMMNFNYRMSRDAVEDQRRSQEDLEKRNINAEKKANEDAEIEIPGYSRNPSIRVRPADAGKLRDAVGTFNSLKSSIDQMKDYTDKYGTYEAYGEGSAKMKSLHTSMLMELKNLHELGVLNGPDLAILSSQLLDPSSKWSLLTRSKTKKAGLDQLLSDLQNKLKSKTGASGYSPVGDVSKVQPSKTVENQPHQVSPRVQEALDWARKNPNDPRATKILNRYGA